MWRVCGLPATRRSSFTTCDHAMLGKGERSMTRIWTNGPTVKRCTTIIFSATAVLVACDRAREPMPTASPPGGMRQELIAQSTDVDWTQLVDLPLLTNT